MALPIYNFYCIELSTKIMRYAVFTDIHANLEALEAVLAKIDDEDPAMLHAAPEEVDASALKPRPWRYRALPTSQGLGMTKQPDSCSLWNARRLSAMLGRM